MHNAQIQSHLWTVMESNRSHGHHMHWKRSILTPDPRCQYPALERKKEHPRGSPFSVHKKKQKRKKLIQEPSSSCKCVYMDCHVAPPAMISIQLAIIKHY
jgi:hypothetical protein